MSEVTTPAVNKSKISKMKIDPLTGKPDMSLYNEADIAKFNSMGKAIVMSDPNSVHNFGLSSQNKLNESSKELLKATRAFDAGEIGKDITTLVNTLVSVDFDPSSKNALIRALMSIEWIRKMFYGVEKTLNKYDTVEGNIEGVVKKLDTGRVMIMKDNQRLANMIVETIQTIRESEDLILAAHQRYDELEAELKQMEATPDNYEMQEIADLRNFLVRLSKRITDMKITRTSNIQSLTEIGIVQDTNSTMCDKIASVITNTIPIWRKQVTIAISLERQKKVIGMVKGVTDATNDMIVKNSNNLRTNAVNAARLNEETIISIETLRTVNQNTIAALKEIKQIVEDGATKRAEIERELPKLEQELKDHFANENGTSGVKYEKLV